MGRKAGFGKRRLTCWFRPWIPVWEQCTRLSLAHAWLQARRCASVALLAATLPTCWDKEPPSARNWASLGTLDCLTLVTAVLGLSSVRVESKCQLIHYFKFKLECRRQFCERLSLSLHPVESSCWSTEMWEKKGAAKRSCHGLTTALHSSSAASLGEEKVEELWVKGWSWPWEEGKG